jgi:excisionase family DNA binding protein
MDEMLTTAEAGNRLRITRRRVRQMIEAGQLPAVRFGRALAIPAAAVEELAGKERKVGRPPKKTEPT